MAGSSKFYSLPSGKSSDTVLANYLPDWLTDWLTNFTEQSPSWGDKKSSSASHEIRRALWKFEVHYRIHKSPQPYLQPDQFSPWNPPPHHRSYFLKISLLLSSQRSSKWSGLLPTGFPTKTLYPRVEFCVPFPLLTSNQRVSPSKSQALWDASLNRKLLRRGAVSTSPNTQVGGRPLVGRPRLLIQYIRSYLPYWRPFVQPQAADASYNVDRHPLITW